jgi:hypothetical protein
MKRSSRNHKQIAHEIDHLINETRILSTERLYALYGITINQDLTVLDESYPTKKFANVGEWATFTVEQDYADEEYDHDPRYRFDDED